MKRIDKLLDEFATKDIIQQHVFYNGFIKGVIAFNPELYDSLIISDVLKALQHFSDKEGTVAEILQSLLYCAEARIESADASIMQSLLAGDGILTIDGEDECIIINARKYDKRAVSEPPTETVLRGPREGFIEDIKTNLALIRKRVKSPALAIERIKIGRVSSTDVAILYISTIATPELIQKVRKKLQEIDLDAILDSHSIQTLIEDHPYSLFKQVGSTEKPDIAVAKILEGRVIIIADGSPVALTIPFIFLEEFQSSEDYYSRHSYATFLRCIRIISAFLAILVPGFYVAVQVFHHSIIPAKFLITLQNAVVGIPLSPLPEILFVTILFEIIREAGLRMPRAVGMALSIVSALVLGETAVKSGIISSPAVMITGLSSIALYTVPNEVDSVSILRIVFTIIGGMFGLLGIMMGSVLLIHYLASFDSFGTPYLAPLGPMISEDLKDSFTKKPLFELKKRPESIPNINKTRMKENGKNG